MPLYKNTGAAFTTSDGRWIDKGAVAKISGRDATRRAYKLRLVHEGPEKVEAEEAEAQKDSAPDDDLSQYHTGNGWYTLPGGVRRHGQKKALAYLRGEE